MRSIKRTARVPYEAVQMFDLVNDVEAYPQFLHWCRDARAEPQGEGVIHARLDIGIRGVHKTFATENRFQRPDRIDIDLLSGPFRHLHGAWEFKPLAEGGCEIDLTLDFDVAGGPLGIVFALLFEEIARTQLNAFVNRARTLYG